MTSTEIDPSVRRVNAAARKDNALIARAAKRTGLAGAALASAAWHLDNAHGRDGNALTGLAELVRDEAERVSHLVEDIQSRSGAPQDGVKTCRRTVAGAERNSLQELPLPKRFPGDRDG